MRLIIDRPISLNKLHGCTSNFDQAINKLFMSTLSIDDLRIADFQYSHM